MTNKRIGKDFTTSANNALAMHMHRQDGVPLSHAFRAVRGAYLDGGAVQARLLRRNLGLSPR